MLGRVLSAKLREYAPANAVEQDNVLQEVMQHYVLASLARAGLFADAIFHGGTCLRIVNQISRFSEDLDFLLKRPIRLSAGRVIWRLSRKTALRKALPLKSRTSPKPHRRFGRPF